MTPYRLADSSYPKVIGGGAYGPTGPPYARTSWSNSNLIARNAELRRAVQELRQDLELAVANIAKLTLDNHQLKTELEHAQRITNIKTRSTSD